ncbi:hypothetical protein F4818DRAFT_207037 [Hypoxylon cercidicola]|nr:hypothetical protein F4818DRAFT_207037 [Hypoxylon cercidicola]
MQQSLNSVLWFLIATPIVCATSFPSTRSLTSIQDHVTVTTVVTGSNGSITQTETFVPTTYSRFVNVSSTFITNTIFTVRDGSSTKLSTYSYKIGPGGVGWNIPTLSGGVPVPFSPPTFLPGDGPTSQSSSSGARSTGSSVTTASGTSLTASKSSNTASSSSVTDSTTSSTSNTSNSLPSSQLSGSSNTVSSRTGTSTGTISSGVIGPTANSTGTGSSGITASSTGTSIKSETSSRSEIAGGSDTSSRTETSGGSDPPVTTTSGAVTSTITAPPTSFSAVTLSGTSFPSNTWVTTTDKEDHTTIVPVIVTGGGIGIVMWNLPPTPNVQFSFPKLPKFHLPCIKVFGVSVGDCTVDPASDGPPDDVDPTENPTETKTTQSTSSKSLSSSSPECTASNTVSNCVVQCATATISNSCASFTTMCSQTRTGCSFTGITSTISSSTSACTTCSSCLGRQEPGDGVPPFQTPGPNPEDEDESMKRGIAGRVRMDPRALDKRGSKSIVNNIGGCNLATGSAPKLTRPPWPAVSAAMLTPDQAGKMAQKYSTISRYDRATTIGPCGVPTTTRLDANAFAAATKYTDYSGRVWDNNNDASLDHAYEKSWIKDFFEQLVATASGSGKLSCTDLNQFFFPKAPAPGTCQYNLIQPVWDGIASEKNLYFVAMSQFLNGDGKGKFFADAKNPLPNTFVGNSQFAIKNDPTWKWAKGKSATQMSATDTLRVMITHFETVLLGALEMKSDSMLPLMDRTNNRIYDALLNVDNKIATDNAMFPNKAAWQAAFGTGGIAGAYKDYMENTVLPQITFPPTYLTDLWENRIKTGIAAAENLPDVKTDSKTNKNPGPLYPAWEEFSSFAKAVDAQYQKSGSYDWEYTFAFQWNRNNKRQEGDEESGDAELTCPFPSSSGVSTASTVSETRTSPSSSDIISSTSSGVSSTITDTTSTITSSRTTSASNTRSTADSTRSSTSSASSTTQPSRTAASDITIPTPSDKPDCNQGYATYTLQAVASAPPNAASLRFYIPEADDAREEWEFDLMPTRDVDPKTNVESWSVGTKAKESLASGKGGKDMEIKWKAPEEAPGNLWPYVQFRKLHIC